MTVKFAVFGECPVDVELGAQAGEMQVMLADETTSASTMLVTLAFDPVQISCDFGVLGKPTMTLDPNMLDGTGSFSVAFSLDPAAYDAGAVDDAELLGSHPVRIEGSFSVEDLALVESDACPFETSGQLPLDRITVALDGSMLRATLSAPDHVFVDLHYANGMKVVLTGLEGELVFE